jgi:hypothetical protein
MIYWYKGWYKLLIQPRHLRLFTMPFVADRTSPRAKPCARNSGSDNATKLAAVVLCLIRAFHFLAAGPSKTRPKVDRHSTETKACIAFCSHKTAPPATQRNCHVHSTITCQQLATNVALLLVLLCGCNSLLTALIHTCTVKTADDSSSGQRQTQACGPIQLTSNSHTRLSPRIVQALAPLLGTV